MHDSDRGDNPYHQSNNNNQGWIERRINNLQRYIHQRRANQEKETPIEKFAKRTARATRCLAFLTVALVAVGLLQYFVYRLQLDEMKIADRPNIALKGNISFNQRVDNPNEFFLFPATFTNSGNTETEVTFVSTGGDDTQFKISGYTYSKWIMGPKSEITFADFFRQAPSQIRDTYIAAKRAFRVAGWAKYFELGLRQE